MRMIVAVAEFAEEEQIAPGAGPPAATTRTAPALPAGTRAGSAAGGGFPSASLPSVAAGAAGGGEDSMLVPNVVGTTVGEARSMIESAGLSVGNVTVTQRQALLDGIIRVAWALDEMIVIAQHPDAGTLVSAVDPPPVDLEAEAPAQAIPEPASLLLFATGLAFIVIVMVRRRARDDRTDLDRCIARTVGRDRAAPVRAPRRFAAQQAARGWLVPWRQVSLLALLAISACEQPSPQQRIENAKAHLRGAMPSSPSPS